MYIVDDKYHGEKEKFDTHEEAVQFCLESDILYYNRAMEYLSENDWTLTESLQLAHEMGFSLENLNSETLATIHYQDALINSIKEAA